MRALIFSLAYLSFVGGAELALKEITDRLPDIDWHIITVNLDGKQPAEERIGSVTVHRVGKGRLAKYLYPFSAFRLAQKLHQEKQFNFVWALMANQAGLAALRFKKEFPSVKYLLTLQEGDSLKKIWSRTLLIRPWYKQIYRRADTIQAISQFLKNRAVKYGYTGPMYVVPNGVDLNNFCAPADPAEVSSLAAKLGLSSQDRVVVTVSRLVKKNGVDTVIKSIHDLPVKLLIIGQGDLECKLKALVQELGLKDRVLFVGHIDNQHLPNYLRLGHAFVRPSRSEGLGTAFLEAMACGTPVIGTNRGGIVDFLSDGETGWICEAGNPKSLSEKIGYILDEKNKATVEGVSIRAKQMVCQKYTWETVVSSMKDVLRSLT